MPSPGGMRAKGTEMAWGKDMEWRKQRTERGVWFADEETEAHGTAATSLVTQKLKL